MQLIDYLSPATLRNARRWSDYPYIFLEEVEGLRWIDIKRTPKVLP